MRVDRGEVLVLEAERLGKTSLLSLIGCMSRPTSGRRGRRPRRGKLAGAAHQGAEAGLASSSSSST
jgi:ABC-type lipoprotein export system ATPase subunit